MLDWNFNDLEAGAIGPDAELSIYEWSVGFECDPVQDFFAEELD